MSQKRDTIIGVTFLIVLGVSCLYVLGGKEDTRDYHSSVDWMWNDYTRALEKAKAENKYILVDFWAVWCTECKKMDKKAFQDPEVQHLLEDFVLLKVDVDKVPQLKSQFLVAGLPTVVVVDANGEEVTRAIGYQTAEQMKKVLREVFS